MMDTVPQTTVAAVRSGVAELRPRLTIMGTFTSLLLMEVSMRIQVARTTATQSLNFNSRMANSRSQTISLPATVRAWMRRISRSVQADSHFYPLKRVGDLSRS